MIKIKNKKILVLVVLVAIFCTVGILEKFNVIDLFKSSNSSQGPTEEEKATERKVNADNKQKFIESGSKTDDPQSSQGAPPSDKTIEISAKQENNNTVTVFTKLKGYNSGSCELTITNGSESSTQKADIFYQPEYSSCAGFSVPIDPIGKGKWTIKLAASSGGITESKTINYEVK